MTTYQLTQTLANWWSRLLCLGLIVAALVVGAADSAQSDKAFQVAGDLFEDKLWERAEREFGAFITRHPESDHLAEALLLQAQSRFQMKRYDAVVTLLTGKLAKAADRADQFRYWIAEAQLEQGNFAAAADSYGELLRVVPGSPLGLRASYGEAFARLKLGEPAKVVTLLRNPEGHFQQAAMARPEDSLAVRGLLVLAEALQLQKEFRAAVEVLNGLAARMPAPELEWQRQYLLAMVELAEKRIPEALTRTTNLITIASAAVKPELQASSLKLQAEILEQQSPALAMEVYDRIVAIKDVPGDRAREAVLKAVDLAIKANLLTNAIGRLESFVGRTNAPLNAAMDLLVFTLGELHLKRYYQSVTNGGMADTNSLSLARMRFDGMIGVFTNSLLLGKAYLNRGWCLWEEAQAPGGEARLPECLVAFQTATERLPISEDQAVARFKWADCQFLQRNFTNAVVTYSGLLAAYENLPAVKARWFDHALHQMVRASIEARDMSRAQRSMERMLAEFPASPLADQSMLLIAQSLLDIGDASKAREYLVTFEKRFPRSALKAETELKLARCYDAESDWASAIRAYDHWSSVFTNHPARPQAEFDRAMAHSRAGNGTNAFVLLTNLVAQFPASRLAPLAQYWVGDHYFSVGAYELAEASYQDRVLIQNTNAPVELAYQARFRAGQAAYFRQGYRDSLRHCTNLINAINLDTNAPPSLRPEAMFLLGEIRLAEPVGPNASPFEKYTNAIGAFRAVPATNWLAARSRGHIGDCYFQLGTINPQNYELATNEFAQVIELPDADVATRSQAEIGLGLVLEQQALEPTRRPEESRRLRLDALDHYLNVLYGKRLRTEKGEQPEMFWVNKAGLAAGVLAAERMGMLREARGIYERLQITLPSMKEIWIRKIEALEQEMKRSSSG